MKKVVIFGGGDQARTAFVYLSKDSPYEVAAFTAHERYLNEEKLLGLNIVPFERLEEFYPPDHFAMFIAMGYAQVNRDRANAYQRRPEQRLRADQLCQLKSDPLG